MCKDPIPGGLFDCPLPVGNLHLDCDDLGEDVLPNRGQIKQVVVKRDHLGINKTFKRSAKRSFWCSETISDCLKTSRPYRPQVRQKLGWGDLHIGKRKNLRMVGSDN